MATIQIDGYPLVLPRMIDKRPDGTFCTRSGVGEDGYAENFQGWLRMTAADWENFYFDYAFEDDTLLSDLLVDKIYCDDYDFMSQKQMLILLSKIGVEGNEEGVPIKRLLAALG